MTLRSVDPFFKKQYQEKTYNCLHFSAEVWLAETGQDILEALKTFLEDASSAKRQAVKLFEEIPKPMHPCIVVMQRPKSVPHLGVYLRGRVLHITPLSVEFLPVKVASRGFVSTRFFLCRL